MLLFLIESLKIRVFGDELRIVEGMCPNRSWRLGSSVNLEGKEDE